MGAGLDGTRTALIIRAMDEESGETARLNEPHAGDLSNGPAVTSLVLGIVALVIQVLAWGDYFTWWDLPGPDTAVSIASGVSIAAGISAIGFGEKGRRLAKAEAPGRITATVGLLLGILSLAIPILVVLTIIAIIYCCTGDPEYPL
jgi:hypothetical protein